VIMQKSSGEKRASKHALVNSKGAFLAHHYKQFIKRTARLTNARLENWKASLFWFESRFSDFETSCKFSVIMLDRFI
jgi:hypothetical protein